MIELWHCTGARSFRPLWCMEELGIPYRLHMLPFPPRWASPEFLQINPLGTIPYLRDGEVEMTESVAMLLHLCERHGSSALAVDAGAPGRAAWLNYLFQADATFTFPLTLVLRYRLLEPEERRLPAVADSYARWYLARMRWVERGLADGRDWLVAGRFTLADIAVAYAVRLAAQLGLDGELGPATRSWWDRCQAREGYQRALAAEEQG